ncbi:RagB/SusD family nutrient uptake outer membrane protein [Rhodocytophaga rosea]|uniref:RagB/SusD family nutrient uptake outer membrane protein n=1 Tax=Rhodocytophaga rosea TaxID=2704465 RepID=A0A6C0GK86_9BACT|nr:RagB/SusD family nutrient uptake outer membrane protein [Rhodocytophaga rosea]QHT68357.1 RagB/SusD family nutrient uptake outer membrane protein [Rhodocytophaga rosea]
MKKIFRTFAVIGIIVFGPIACKDEFLEVPVTGQITDAQLNTQAGLEGMLIGVYSQLDGSGGGGEWHGGSVNWLWGSIRGGDANKGSNSGDFTSMTPIERFEAQTNNGELNNKWMGSFEGVARANALLAVASKADAVPADAKTRISAEARFLRGHFYFELRKDFKMVPWVDETKNIAETVKVPNNTDIWPNIEADFQYAVDNLPETHTEVGRANKWAAMSYLAKAYMFQKKFVEAKALFDNIIANGKTTNGKKYALFPDFDAMFTLQNENSEESIFAYQATGGGSSTNNSLHELAMAQPYGTAAGSEAGSDCCGFFQPSFDLAASYRTANGLPLLDGSYRTGANELKTDQGLASSDAFTPDQGPLDPRIDHTIGRRGLPFEDWGNHPGKGWIRDQNYAGPYTQEKYALDKNEYATRDASGWTPGYQATNFMIIRFADVLLMAAEAEVEIGDLEKARTYVNLVRARAANPDTFEKKADGTNAANYVISEYPAGWTKDYARDAVRFERKLELSLEGHRFYDLVRWGIAEQVLNPYLVYEASKIPSQFGGPQAVFSSNQDEYLAIPQRQIDLQGKDVLTQNPGF